MSLSIVHQKNIQLLKSVQIIQLLKSVWAFARACGTRCKNMQETTFTQDAGKHIANRDSGAT